MISDQKLKIALLHLYSNGDCLFATVVVKQIKEDYPNSHLTWFVGVQSKGMLLNNPMIDARVEIDARGEKGIQVWHETHSDLLKRKAAGEFDLFFSTQIISDNEKNYCGSIRATIFKNYPHPIRVSYTPELFLSEAEIQKVTDVTQSWNLSRFKNIVLFECAPVSGQIPINPQIATRMAEEALKHLNETCFILTSGEKINSSHPAIFDASVLGIRENAELINHCTHLIGCSSGISWISISKGCKKIPNLQFLSNRSFYYNSMKRDFLYLGQDSSHIIETEYAQDEQKVINEMILFVQDYRQAYQQMNHPLPDRSKTVYSLSRTRILNGHTLHALGIIRNCFRLNYSNWYYYFLILKLIALYPYYQYLRFRKTVLKEPII